MTPALPLTHLGGTRPCGVGPAALPLRSPQHGGQLRGSGQSSVRCTKPEAGLGSIGSCRQRWPAGGPWPGDRGSLELGWGGCWGRRCRRGDRGSRPAGRAPGRSSPPTSHAEGSAGPRRWLDPRALVSLSLEKTDAGLPPAWPPPVQGAEREDAGGRQAVAVFCLGELRRRVGGRARQRVPPAPPAPTPVVPGAWLTASLLPFLMAVTGMAPWGSPVPPHRRGDCPPDLTVIPGGPRLVLAALYLEGKDQRVSGRHLLNARPAVWPCSRAPRALDSGLCFCPLLRGFSGLSQGAPGHGHAPRAGALCPRDRDRAPPPSSSHPGLHGVSAEEACVPAAPALS